jgi:ATP-dependent protease ClpP protease subunit
MAEIFLGEIVDGSAAEFRAALAAAPDGPVRVRINSPGGIVDEALDMYRAIVERGGVTAYVTGIAASAATIVLCGADAVQIAEGAQVMTHAPSVEISGSALDLRRTAESLERTETALLRLYAERTGRETNELLPLIANVTYLDAKEAVAFGFADEIIPMRKRDLAAVNLAGLPQPPVTLVRAVAQARRDMAAPAAPAPAPRATNAAVDPQIIEVLGLADDASLEMVLATIMALTGATPGAAAPEEPPAEMADDGDDDPMTVAVEGVPPEKQAQILALHARNNARLAALEADARATLTERVPQNLRTWAKKQSFAVLRDFVAALPAAASPSAAAQPPPRTTNTTPDPNAATEAELAVAKALGRSVDYVRRAPKVAT